MEMPGVGIAGVGSYVPEVVVTNHDLEKYLDTTDEWIRTKIGIEERRIARDDQAMSDLAIAAAADAIEHARVDPDQIDMVIVAGSNHDMLMPNTSTLVCRGLGIRNAGALDIRNACAGFVYALGVGAAWIQNGTSRCALVIGAEVHSKIINWHDRTTCVFFSDGAGAVILKPTRPGTGILSSYFGADGENADAIVVRGGGSRIPASIETIEKKWHYAEMDGKRVKSFIQYSFPTALKRALEPTGYGVEDLDMVLAHQANLHLIHEALDGLGIDRRKTRTVIEKYGNSGSASIPTVMNEAVREGAIRPGDLVACVGYGAGLVYGANVIRWVGEDDFVA